MRKPKLMLLQKIIQWTPHGGLPKRLELRRPSDQKAFQELREEGLVEDDDGYVVVTRAGRAAGREA